MKTFFLPPRVALAGLLLFPALLLVAQSRQGYLPWDYRSTAWLSGRVGIGYQFSNQNRNLRFFAETDLCASCFINHYVKERPADLHAQLHNNRYRANLHLRFETIKDFMLYGTRFSRKSADLQFKNLSWTYLTGVGASLEAGLYRPGRLFDLETGALRSQFDRKSKIRLRYDVVSRYHSYYYRRLSNTVGYLTLNFSKLDDRWGINFNWGNDVFIIGRLRNFVTNHDHGETNSAYITGYWRPYERRGDAPNMPYAYQPESLQKLELGPSLRMITDRRTMKRSTTNQARSGTYDVVGLRNSFHGYYGIRFRADGGCYTLGGLLGKDDLLWGRGMQRYAHQGYPRLTVKRIFIKVTGGTNSPLFPWETQPLFYRHPRFYYELNTDAHYLMQRWW
ncbi:MAG TPA: hypothetical protein PKD78_07650 [Saprospiraceae bacterium]|nr:hypothetical protein [Saprospiraceae bacterium]